MLKLYLLLIFSFCVRPGESRALRTGAYTILDGASDHITKSSNSKVATNKDAYITLLYGGFLLGARVLGQSLKESGTTKELIALCTEDVSDSDKRILEADGWTIKSVSTINNPYDGFSSRGTYFSGAFTKLHAWNMTEYNRIVYLDADTIVISNIDHLFDCGTFCARYRHSDLFNSGVFVVEPSKAIFNDMMKKIEVTPSYTHGDQGFLNIYFKDLKYAPMFNWSNSSRQRQPMRLPAGLNSDVGLYYMNGRWLIPTEQRRVIHYTFGPVKPWMWWTYVFSDVNMIWKDIRIRLPQYWESRSIFHRLVPIFWVPIPLLMLINLYFYKMHRCSHSFLLSNRMKTFISLSNKYYFVFPLTFLLLSYYLAFSIIPTTMLPAKAEYAFWLWSNFYIFIFYGLFCYLLYTVNKLHDNIHSSVPKRKLQTFLLYLIFTLSYILLKVLPPFIQPIYNRVKVLAFLMVLHLIVNQLVGQRIIHIWSGVKVNQLHSTNNGFKSKNVYY